jgi:hypothetical protein
MQQLTARQTTILDRAIALVPTAHQSAFTQSVANIVNRWQFAPHDAEVRDLLRMLLSKHGISIGAALLAPQRPPADRRHGDNTSWRRWANRKQQTEINT